MKRLWSRMVAAGLPAPGGRAAAQGAGGAVPVAQSGVYRNLFREIGKKDQEIDAKVKAALDDFFSGDAEVRCYYPRGADEAYILDSGNNDVRSEGVSYGMMIAVQAGIRPEFDRLWSFARRHMRHADGDRQGLFAWRVDTQGNVLSEPKVVRRSGNPWYDESVVRAVQKASPLPPPPEAGIWPFVFKPEDLG